MKVVDSFNKASTVIALSFILASVAYAWTGPTGLAPSNNVLAPVNISGDLQVKQGGLGVANFAADSVTVGSTVNAAAITAPKFCIGTSCLTSWPDMSAYATQAYVNSQVANNGSYGGHYYMDGNGESGLWCSGANPRTGGCTCPSGYNDVMSTGGLFHLCLK